MSARAGGEAVSYSSTNAVFTLYYSSVRFVCKAQWRSKKHHGHCHEHCKLHPLNFSLQHCLFRQLLADMSAEHTDLLVHNNVRWLSKGKVLDRFCELRQEIGSFLCTCTHKRAANLLEHMLDEQFMAVYFLCDISGHLNTLNL